MAFLHKLLSDEGSDHQKSQKSQFKGKANQEDSIVLPIFICRDRRSFEPSWQKSEKSLSTKGSRRRGSSSEKSKAKETPRRDEPGIDDIAIKAMISILSGYVGQYLKDENFREKVGEKGSSCLVIRNKKHLDNEIFARMELGIQSIERLVKNKEMDLESLQNSIKIFNILAASDSKSSRNSLTKNPDSSLSACAQLYLSIIYKIAKNDRISARHLLQVFSESPFLGRTHLLPELWEHFFLPHLLHVKIWYTKEVEFLSDSNYFDKEKKIKALNKQYNALLDNGTVQFSMYYKEWLTIGGQAPSIPSVPLPSKASYAHSRRRSSDSSPSHHFVSNQSLYQEVFGHISDGRSVDLDKDPQTFERIWDLQEQEKVFKEEDIKQCTHVEVKNPLAHRSSSSHIHRIQKAELWPESQKSDYFGFLACKAKPKEFFVEGNYVYNNEKIESTRVLQLNDINRAISSICSSESLSEYEMAIRAVSEGWLNSRENLMIETSLSQPSVIQGIIEVLYVSSDDEILELAISILAELAAKSEKNRKQILDSDPRLEVSIRLLKSSNLFLKAAVLLYLVKPNAQKMISMEWVPLALRVLEYGDQSQTLFTVRCSPHEAAYYFLDQLLTGFDEDRNLENARQIISLGGLRVLARMMDIGDTCERIKAVSVLLYCIEADGSCRHYLAKNLKKDSIISLLVLGKGKNAQWQALLLLAELLCISRTKHRIEILTELKKGWDCLNTMHILLLCLQKAQPEERPIIAVILLQLDLMGDPLEFSIYIEEAIDVILKALDCSVLDEKFQDRLAKALLFLGGHFSYTGEPDIEKWLLKAADLQQNTENSFNRKNSSMDGYLHLDKEDKYREKWQKKTAEVLLTSGNRRLLAALSDSIANSIPSLAQASLVTVCWMSNYLNILGDKELQLAACSILVPQLMKCLYSNRALDERILASFSLFNLTKGTDYLLNQSRLEKEVLDCLHTLSRVTWTAKELISLITSS